MAGIKWRFPKLHGACRTSTRIARQPRLPMLALYCLVGYLDCYGWDSAIDEDNNSKGLTETITSLNSCSGKIFVQSVRKFPNVDAQPDKGYVSSNL